MIQPKRIALVLLLGTGALALCAAADTESAPERKALQFERAKQAAALAQAHKEAQSRKDAPAQQEAAPAKRSAVKNTARPKQEAGPAPGAEQQALKFERGKLAAAQAEAQREAGQAKAGQPDKESKREAVRLISDRTQ
jgi:hypothetical protein